MYIIHNLVERIKSQAKIKGKKTTEMLEHFGLNKNMLSSMNTRGSWIQADNLAKFADYLDCSVDYLLGRTENPNAHKTHANDVVINPYNDEQLAAIIEAYKQLNLVGKAKLLVETDKIVAEESNLISKGENTSGNNYLLLAGKGGSAEVEIKDSKGLNEEVEKLRKKHGID